MIFKYTHFLFITLLILKLQCNTPIPNYPPFIIEKATFMEKDSLGIYKNIDSITQHKENKLDVNIKNTSKVDLSNIKFSIIDFDTLENLVSFIGKTNTKIVQTIKVGQVFNISTLFKLDTCKFNNLLNLKINATKDTFKWDSLVSIKIINCPNTNNNDTIPPKIIKIACDYFCPLLPIKTLHGDEYYPIISFELFPDEEIDSLSLCEMIYNLQDTTMTNRIKLELLHSDALLLFRNHETKFFFKLTSTKFTNLELTSLKIGKHLFEYSLVICDKHYIVKTVMLNPKFLKL